MTDEPETSSRPLTLVGVGASAGGLKAFEALVGALPHPLDPPLSFALIQHLDPKHHSALPEITQRATHLPVREIQDGMPLEPRAIYICPPGRYLYLEDECFRVSEGAGLVGSKLPIDELFASMARELGDRAAAVVLSGSGSDGAFGVRAIKASNGLVIAQSPSTADHDSMPRNALATGAVDLELAPEAIPKRLIAYMQHALHLDPRRTSPPESDGALDEILVAIRDQTGRDFSGYKRNTMRRRAERRMAVHQLESLDRYLRHLRSSPEEIATLGRELFIGVTGFFRDDDAFRSLEQRVIPEILERPGSSRPVRVWVAGCSTGEEAYSIAILLIEAQRENRRRRKIQIFATDADERAIAQARQGLYPANVLASLSESRRQRFFVAEHRSGDEQITAYRVKKSVRDVIVFSEQNVLEDAPFSRMDLIVCRNLLIYLGGPLQKKLLSLFHYALNPAGFLFLGTSETVGEQSELFTSIDRESKIYQRQAVESRPAPPVIARAPQDLPRETERPDGPSLPSGRADGAALRAITERALLEHVCPAAVLVERTGEILYVHGRTGLYLELRPGESRLNNVLDMAREGLHAPLALALNAAAQSGEPVVRRDVTVRSNGEWVRIDLVVQPLAIGERSEDHDQAFLVAFELHGEPLLPAEAEDEYEDDPSKARLIELETQLRRKDEHLQTTREQLDSSTEELKSSNEELQSMNEELQSTNEELETSKEELQSINEELTTTNAELESKVADLSQANNDMNNLLAGTGVATIFVDTEMRILRFTPAASRIVRLIPGDVGRPLGDLAARFETYGNLVEDTREVLDTLIPRQTELGTRDGTWYAMRIAPYRTAENVIQGAVLTFVDITQKRRVEEELRRSEERLQMALSVAPAMVYSKDRNLAFTWIARPLFGIRTDEIVGRSNFEVLPSSESAEALTQAERRALDDGRRVEEQLSLRMDDEDLDLLAIVEPSRDGDGRIIGLEGALIKRGRTENDD